jgi:hypothetical protein
MTVAVAAAAIGGAGLAARSAPWMAYVASGLVVLALPCGSLCLWWAIATRERGGGDSNDAEGDGGGGGRGGGDRSPPKGSPESGADWWPEFERQFAAHVSHLDARGDVTTATPRSVHAAPSPSPSSRSLCLLRQSVVDRRRAALRSRPELCTADGNVHARGLRGPPFGSAWRSPWGSARLTVTPQSRSLPAAALNERAACDGYPPGAHDSVSPCIMERPAPLFNWPKKQRMWLRSYIQTKAARDDGRPHLGRRQQR